MITPARALVRPRVFCEGSEGSLPLEDAIAEIAGVEPRGAVELIGGRGSGRTTALAHLAAVPSLSDRIVVVDRADPRQVETAAKESLVVFVAGGAPPKCRLVRLHMAPWSEDDWIEFLMASHPSESHSIMQRLCSARDRHLLAGNAEVCAAILDRMVTDQSILTVRQALRSVLEAGAPESAAIDAAADYCLASLFGPPRTAELAGRRLARAGCVESLRSLLRHKGVRVAIAANRIAGLLSHADWMPDWERKWPSELVAEVACDAANCRPALGMLERLFCEAKPAFRPTVASLLHAAGGGWMPADGRGVYLAGARLVEARWGGIDLSGADLQDADFSASDLDKARLERVVADGANFTKAWLRGASLEKVVAKGASFSLADLSNADLRDGLLQKADFRQANLNDSCLRGADLCGAKLSGAAMRQADLSHAVLRGAAIAGADFSRADFRGASLQGLSLRQANCTGASFTMAQMQHCNLEGIELADADFRQADLRGALLSASVMPGADFRGAALRDAGLGDVRWPDADLQSADLQGSSFHFGSSRSGLVDSPIASEGTRTGFYTDEFQEQYFKSPEEIRKADFRGVSLRDANITDVDFYLVDLRGAKFTRSQEDQLRRCGAILDGWPTA